MAYKTAACCGTSIRPHVIRETLVSVVSDWISPPQRAPLAGDETFVGLEAAVADFWRFAISDLRIAECLGLLERDAVDASDFAHVLLGNLTGRCVL